MYQVEVRRLQDLSTKFLAQKLPEREARRKKGAAFIREGADLFGKDQFEDALKKYDEAIEADPQNRIALYQYAVTLYRMLDYNRSIVYLQLAEGEGVNEAERQYYLALNFYAIKDYDNSNGRIYKGHRFEVYDTDSFRAVLRWGCQIRCAGLGTGSEKRFKSC